MSAKREETPYVYYGLRYHVIDSLIESGNNISAVAEATAMLEEASADSSDFGMGLANFCFARIYTAHDNGTAIEYLRRSVELLAPVRDSAGGIFLGAAPDGPGVRENKKHDLEWRLRVGRIHSAVTGIILISILIFLIVRSRHRMLSKNRQLVETIRQMQDRENAAIAAIATIADTAAAATATDAAEGQDNPGRDAEIFSRLSTLLQEENIFRTTLDRSTLASRLGTNTNYLAEAIRRYGGGRTVSEYINHCRLSNAAIRLSDPGRPADIEDVWEDCGFSSRSTFFRKFRKEYGMTPSEYQNAAR